MGLESIGLRRKYVNITVKVMDIIHLQHSVSETGFCLLLQVELTHLGPINRPISYIFWAQLSTFHSAISWAQLSRFQVQGFRLTQHCFEYFIQ
jgi:hypothetical protein